MKFKCYCIRDDCEGKFKCLTFTERGGIKRTGASIIATWMNKDKKDDKMIEVEVDMDEGA